MDERLTSILNAVLLEPEQAYYRDVHDGTESYSIYDHAECVFCHAEIRHTGHGKRVNHDRTCPVAQARDYRHDHPED